MLKSKKLVAIGILAAMLATTAGCKIVIGEEATSTNPATPAVSSSADTQAATTSDVATAPVAPAIETQASTSQPTVAPVVTQAQQITAQADSSFSLPAYETTTTASYIASPVETTTSMAQAPGSTLQPTSGSAQLPNAFGESVIGAATSSLTWVLDGFEACKTYGDWKGTVQSNFNGSTMLVTETCKGGTEFAYGVAVADMNYYLRFVSNASGGFDAYLDSAKIVWRNCAPTKLGYSKIDFGTPHIIDSLLRARDNLKSMNVDVPGELVTNASGVKFTRYGVVNSDNTFATYYFDEYGKELMGIAKGTIGGDTQVTFVDISYGTNFELLEYNSYDYSEVGESDFIAAFNAIVKTS